MTSQKSGGGRKRAIIPSRDLIFPHAAEEDHGAMLLTDPADQLASKQKWFRLEVQKHLSVFVH